MAATKALRNPCKLIPTLPMKHRVNTKTYLVQNDSILFLNLKQAKQCTTLLSLLQYCIVLQPCTTMYNQVPQCIASHVQPCTVV